MKYKENSKHMEDALARWGQTLSCIPPCITGYVFETGAEPMCGQGGPMQVHSPPPGQMVQL